MANTSVLRDRFATLIVAAARAAVGLAFAVLIGAVTIQVVGRSLVGVSPVWTEELTRFALLYLAAFGAGLSLRSGDLVNVDIAVEMLPPRLGFALRLIAALLTAGLCLMLLPSAWRYMEIGALQTSPALGWRMDAVHATMPVLLGGLALFAAIRVLGMAIGASDGRPPALFDPDAEPAGESPSGENATGENPTGENPTGERK